MPDVMVCRRSDDGTIVLRRDGRYLAISPRTLDIWSVLDGTADLRSLAQTFSAAAGRDMTSDLIALMQTLTDCNFVAVEQTALPQRAQMTGFMGLRPAKTLLEGYVTFAPQLCVDRCYAIVKPLFRTPIFMMATLLAIAGAAAFLSIGEHTTVPPNMGAAVSLGFAFVLSIVAHETAHAITLRHFGGQVSQAGIGWYWFAPTAFVNTSDAHLLSRHKRIVVCLAGPASDALVAGAAAIVAAANQGSVIAAWSSTLASILYLGIFWNLNPLLETDGYYALTDILQRPNLRYDGIEQLLGHRRQRDLIGTLYGVGASLYAAIYVVVAVPTFVRDTIGPWIAPVASPTVIDMLAAAAALSAGISISSASWRDARKCFSDHRPEGANRRAA
jgi:putative peptide zinc metalloprotease protein